MWSHACDFRGKKHCLIESNDLRDIDFFLKKKRNWLTNEWKTESCLSSGISLSETWLLTRRSISWEDSRLVPCLDEQTFAKNPSLRSSGCYRGLSLVGPGCVTSSCSSHCIEASVLPV